MDPKISYSGYLAVVMTIKKINTKKINDNIAFLHKKTFAKIKISQKIH